MSGRIAPVGMMFTDRGIYKLGETIHAKSLFRMRGSYSEGWTPFWITAHFLAAAAEFERMGVDLDGRAN